MVAMAAVRCVTSMAGVASMTGVACLAVVAAMALVAGGFLVAGGVLVAGVASVAAMACVTGVTFLATGIAMVSIATGDSMAFASAMALVPTMAVIATADFLATVTVLATRAAAAYLAAMAFLVSVVLGVLTDARPRVAVRHLHTPLDGCVMVVVGSVLGAHTRRVPSRGISTGRSGHTGRIRVGAPVRRPRRLLLPIDHDLTGYAASMELLVILAIPVAVAAVIIYRKATGKHPNEPLTPDNDGE